jgi:hypothetical protein
MQVVQKNGNILQLRKLRGRIKKSNDHNDENFKNEEKPFHVLIVLAVLENQDLITPTQRAIIASVGVG